ncbi:MAG TPA: NAD(P)H-binding protein [Candidatus Nanopelagicales bacterium]|nr:NAD(P)H-binding protein [Candidatus Nanopelagicales bacterium]
MTTKATRVLLAGATGAVGRELLPLLRARGLFVRTLSQSAANAARVRDLADEVVVADATRPGAVAPALSGIHTVVSCLGASVALSLSGRRGYAAVDLAANTALLDAAQQAGARRFVYLSAHPGPGYAHTRYMRAHLDMEDRLRASPLSSSSVRPTGIFTALDDMVTMARRGLGFVPGNGLAKTNPVHPLDVAEALVGVLDEGPAELSIGGPEVLSREDIMRLAFEAIGKKPKILHVPPALFRAQSALLRPVHPRLSDLLEFVAAVTTSDSVAPSRGTRPLGPWFAAR